LVQLLAQEDKTLVSLWIMKQRRFRL
jgi:hypothetical protein